jgi:hypothetical protein
MRIILPQLKNGVIKLPGMPHMAFHNSPDTPDMSRTNLESSFLDISGRDGQGC